MCDLLNCPDRLTGDLPNKLAFLTFKDAAGVENALKLDTKESLAGFS